MNVEILAILLLLTGILAGFLGALLGLGGGIIVTPILTLLLGVEIRYAIGASIIAVIATSSGATIAYLKDEVLNLRVAMFLEIFTTTGALLGALLIGVFQPMWLFFLFGFLLLFQSWNMYKKLRGGEKFVKSEVKDAFAEKLKLGSSYFDRAAGQEVSYRLERVSGGAALMFGAGVASALLGIGSGAFKVMAMDSIMKMPLKPSSATSNLMMGVTAAASATVYFFNGMIQPEIAVPLAIGILLGATLGSRVMPKIPTRRLRLIFIPVIFLMGFQMILKGFGVG